MRAAVRSAVIEPSTSVLQKSNVTALSGLTDA
jgi:hypothetical protein